MSGWRGQVAAILAAALCAVALLLLAPRLARSEGRPVSVALVLAVDVSASVNGERFQLQRRGYAAALEHPAVIEAALGTPRGRIALAIVEWASVNAQRVVLPWTVIASAEDGRAAAAVLLAAPRSFEGLTAIGAAIDASAALLDALPWPADRRVIDVSGDGVSNDGGPPAAARDAAVARGITINGLAIMAEARPAAPGAIPAGAPDPPLDQFYRDHVAGGPGGFVVAIEGFDSFAYALVGKMIREVAGAAPATRTAAVGR